MSQFNPRISRQTLDKIVAYLNDRPYKEVAVLLSELYMEVQAQVPKPKVARADEVDRVDKMIHSTPPSSNGHYAKRP